MFKSKEASVTVSPLYSGLPDTGMMMMIAYICVAPHLTGGVLQSFSFNLVSSFACPKPKQY